MDYVEHTMSVGTDAMAASYVECQIGEEDNTSIVWGVGIDTSIVTSSLKPSSRPSTVPSADCADCTDALSKRAGYDSRGFLGNREAPRRCHVPCDAPAHKYDERVP